MVLWRYRYALPFSESLGIGRRDIPSGVKSRYEDAIALVEENRRIMRVKKREIEKELTVAEREQLAQTLADLEAKMLAMPFDVEAFETAHSRAERAFGEHLSRWRKGEIREYAESISIAIGVALLLRIAVVEPFKIPSGSMIPTLMIGDHIFVNKFSYGPLIPFTEKRIFPDLPPERADVMVFKFPENPEQDFIKRVIATPGDTLEAIDGRPIINGWLVPNCYVGPFQHEGKTGELYVEYLHQKAYFALFDSTLSTDKCESSRDCPNGTSCRLGVCGLLQGPFKVKADEAWVMGDNRNNSHDSRSWRGGLGAGVPFDNIKGRAMFVFATFGPGGGFLERFLVNVMGTPKLPKSQDNLQPALDKCLREIPETTEPPAPK